jgi:hypothetical protein
MPAKLHVTGAAHVYVGHKGSLPAAGLYLGTCERSPEFETEFKWGDIQNDIAGGAPIDLIFKGMSSKLQFLMTRFNDHNVQNFVGNVNSRVARHGINHQPGYTDGGQIGSLSEYTHASVQNSGYWLAVKFEFAALTPADSYLPKGYFFPSVTPSQFGYEEGSLGTNAKKLQLGVEAHACVVKALASPNAHAVDGGNAGMNDGNYILRLYTTSTAVFDFATLPNID